MTKPRNILNYIGTIVYCTYCSILFKKQNDYKNAVVLVYKLYCSTEEFYLCLDHPIKQLKIILLNFGYAKIIQFGQNCFFDVFSFVL